MSNEALNWAYRQRLKSPLKPVLVALANRADNDSFTAFPGVELIAFDIGMSETTVIRATKKLVQLGLISKECKQSYRKRYLHNVYTLHLDVYAPGSNTQDGSVPHGDEPYRLWRSPDGNTSKTRLQSDTLTIKEPSSNHHDINKAQTTTPVKKEGTDKKSKTFLPESFELSDELLVWGERQGYSKSLLQQHLDHFKDAAAARGYQYVDWSAAFRNAVKSDWAKLSVVNKGPVVAPKAPFHFVTKHDAIVDKNRAAKERFLAMKRREAEENGI